MYKEHKKLYKAGKNWVVATLTAVTITLLGGVSLSTAHADSTTENYQSSQTISSNQPVQNDNSGNSDNSFTLNQAATPQNNQIVPINQTISEIRSNPANRITSNTVASVASPANSNSSDPSDSSLWYTPEVAPYEDDVKKSGLGDVERIVPDVVHPNIIVYYSFLNPSDCHEIQKYAHKSEERYIYIKNPKTGEESLADRASVYFNRWVAVDKDRNNQVVGLGPWVLSLTSPKSFPKYDIPQIEGYTSYCNGEKSNIIDKEQVSDSQTSEDYHITYKSNSDFIAKKTRTIVINYPNGEKKSTIVQNAQLEGSTYSWPKYIIHECDGYDSYVDGYKESIVPSQTIDIYDNNKIINVTYKKKADIHRTITRTIKIHEINGNISTLQQIVNYTRDAFTDAQGNIVSYSSWVADGDSSWDEYKIPQHEGYKSQVDSRDSKVVPSQDVSPNDNNIIVDVTYKEDLITFKHHGTVTRIIFVHDINGKVNKIQQTVNYTYNVIIDGQGNIISYTDLAFDGKNSWDEYEIPQHEGYKSQVDSKDSKVVPSQSVNPSDSNEIVNVTYKKDLINSQQHKTITRTIFVHDINGKISTISQSANFTRNIVTDAQGNIVSHTNWVADKNSKWDEYEIPQHEGYKSQVDSKDSKVVPSQDVNSNSKDVNVSITYVKTEDINDHGDPSRLINEVPYDSTTASNKVNTNYGNLDDYRLTENSQGQLQLIARGWHATGESNFARYRYMIVFDNSLGHEIARQKLIPQVRPDVQRAHSDITNSLYSGFNITIEIPNSSMNHSLSLISRYSNDPNNGENSKVDYWFKSLAFNESNQANLDGLNSNGNNLTVNGWHATNQAVGRPYHYIIAWDQNLGHEIARQKVTVVSRPDVANVYKTVANARNSGFSVNFKLTPQFLNDNIQFISRWTDDPAGNGNAIDYWFNPLTEINRGNLDSYDISNNGLHIAGWHANDISILEPYHFLILFDQTTNQQIAASLAPTKASLDVANAFGSDTRSAGHSRFDYSFENVKLVPGHRYAVVSRYSSINTGNGDNGTRNHTDYWYPSFSLDPDQKAGYLDSVKSSNNQLTISGWFIDNASFIKPNAYIILLNNDHEIKRQRLSFTSRPDVGRAYPHIINSGNGGFKASFDLAVSELSNLKVVLRYTDDPAGNGNASDIWINVPQYMIKQA